MSRTPDEDDFALLNTPGGPDFDDDKREKQRRRPVACKSCHSLKVKCTPADENDPAGPCIRCLNAKRKCEIDINQPRKRRRRTEAVRPERDDRDEIIANLQKQVEALSSQVNARYPGQLPQATTSAQYRNDLSSLELGSPVFVSKYDLEREIITLCDLSLTSLSELTNDVKATSARRMQMLRDDHPQDLVAMGLLLMEEAQLRLDAYKNRLFQYHPYIEVPDLAQELLAELPFLFNAVMSVSNSIFGSDDVDRALRIDNEATRLVAIEVLVSGTKSVDLIKSLLLLSLWYNSPELFQNRRYHLLNSLAVTLLHDVGIISRPCFSFRNGAVTLDKRKEDNLEYNSLVLILYFTSVNFSLILRRAIYVRWTQYVEECCVKLESSGIRKYEKLALFCRLNNLLERIHHMVHNQESETGLASKYVVTELHRQLLHLHGKMDLSDMACCSYFYSIEAYLHEPILRELDYSNGAKLSAHTISLVGKCTTSCLRAIEQFTSMATDAIATVPLFYSARVVFTAGMLLRLRYIILSLPSHIERDLVPVTAVYSIQKLNRIIEAASLEHKTNHSLRKLRLVVQLFIQTYATQVQELLRKNGETPTNFAPTNFYRFPKRELNEMEKLSSLYQKSSRSILTGDHRGIGHDPLDLLSYAASHRRENSGKEWPKGPSSPLASVAPDTTKSPQLPKPRGVTDLLGPNEGTGPEAFQKPPAPSAPPISQPFLQPDVKNPMPFVDDTHLTRYLANPDQLETSYMALNDEFWVNLLSTDSDRVNFTQGNLANNMGAEDVFFMNS